MDARAAVIAGLSGQARTCIADPDLGQLETLVSIAEVRCRRAKERLERAQTEANEAAEALEQAKAERAAWIAGEHGPQLMML